MLSQQLINIIVIASGYILIGISFSIVFRACGFLNVSHAVPFTVAPYSAFYIIKNFSISLWTAALAGLILSGVLGLFLEYVIFRSLRNKEASSLVMLLASLGIYVIFENVLSLIFGNSPHPLQAGVVSRVMDILGASMTAPQMVLIVAAIAVASLTTVATRYTKIGIAYRAVCFDHELARVSGLDHERIILQAFFLGSVLAGLAGILSANDTNIHPSMGLKALFMGIVVVVVGGKQSILGITLASMLVSVAQTTGVWKISSQWQDAIAFVILLIFLLFRPQGFLGKKVKKVTL